MCKPSSKYDLVLFTMLFPIFFASCGNLFADHWEEKVQPLFIRVFQIIFKARSSPDFLIQTHYKEFGLPALLSHNFSRFLVDRNAKEAETVTPLVWCICGTLAAYIDPDVPFFSSFPVHPRYILALPVTTVALAF
jgi:hypothetical protein